MVIAKQSVLCPRELTASFRPLRHVPRVRIQKNLPAQMQMLHSSQAYYLHDQHTWHKIDYNAKAESWMKPLIKGKQTGLVEIPANWLVIVPTILCSELDVEPQ